MMWRYFIPVWFTNKVAIIDFLIYCKIMLDWSVYNVKTCKTMLDWSVQNYLAQFCKVYYLQCNLIKKNLLNGTCLC